MGWMSALITALLFGQNSLAQLPMNFDLGTLSLGIECNFRATSKFSCNDLINDIFSDYKTIVHREDSPGNALVTLSLTDEAGPNGRVIYTYTWKSRESTQLTDWPYSITLDQSAMDEVQLRSTLSMNAATGIQVYLKVTKVSVEDGKMNVSSEPNSNSTSDGSNGGLYQRLAQSPIYIDLDLDGSFSMQGNKPYDSKSTFGGVFPEVGFLKERYKFSTGGFYTNRESSVPTDTGYIHSSIVQKGVGSIFVYSMGEKRKWSVAVFNMMSSDPNSNIDASTTTGAGIEYTAVPFRVTENRELAFRVGGNFNTLNLGQANGLGHVSEQYASVFAKIYFYWVLNQSKFSIKTTAGIEQNLKYRGYEKFNVDGTLGYQINKATKLTASAKYSYTANSLTYPLNPDLSNALQVSQMSGVAGKALNMSLGLEFTIGNIKRKTRDRRWAH